MVGNTHVLPDSRLHEPIGSVMADWEMPDGSIVRIEMVPIYCANCGKPYGHVPKDNTSFVFWLCRPCYDTHGVPATTFAVPDDEFCQAVAHEMVARHGRELTDLEVFNLLEHGDLAKELELLIRESPYKVYHE